MTERTDAHALHALLVRVRDSEQSRIQTAWAEVLEAELGTHEFARRHAETVSLLSSTLNQIETMPNEAVRERYRSYAGEWWMAVVGANWQWAAPMNTADIIADTHLDLLASAADLIESKFQETTASPIASDLEPLRVQCSQWLDSLSADADLNAGLRLSLIRDLEHVLWLIENAGLFGAARVAQSAQGALGGLTLAGVQIPMSSQGGWKSRLAQFAGALLLLSCVFDASTVALESGTEFVGEVASIIQNAADDPAVISHKN